MTPRERLERDSLTIFSRGSFELEAATCQRRQPPPFTATTAVETPAVPAPFNVIPTPSPEIPKTAIIVLGLKMHIPEISEYRHLIHPSFPDCLTITPGT
jgi:hypothetical protein